MNNINERIDKHLEQARIDKQHWKSYSECIFELNRIKGD